jgi:hypothetical protein
MQSSNKHWDAVEWFSKIIFCVFCFNLLSRLPLSFAYFYLIKNR